MGRVHSLACIWDLFWELRMLFVKLGETEYLPFLHDQTIKLKNARAHTIVLTEWECPELLVKDLEAEFDGHGNPWFHCGFHDLAHLLSLKDQEIFRIRRQVLDGSFEQLNEVKHGVFV